MSAKQPYGMFPTPYGVAVPVFQPNPINPADPDAVLFEMEGTAIFAGIHDKAERRRFAENARRLGGCPRFEEYGGHPVPKVTLPRPRKPAYPRVSGMEADIPIETLVTGMLDHGRWCDRADFLLDVIRSNREHAATWASDAMMAEIYPIGLSIILTAALEHLCETEVDCIEAAALYALTEHDEWRRAGISWLEPFRATWFRDWCATRPHYTAFARGLGTSFDLPLWVIQGGAE